MAPDLPQTTSHEEDRELSFITAFVFIQSALRPACLCSVCSGLARLEPASLYSRSHGRLSDLKLVLSCCVDLKYMQFVTSVALLLGIVTALTVGLFSVSRIVMAASRDWLLPPFLARISKRTQTPLVAQMVLGVIIGGWGVASLERRSCGILTGRQPLASTSQSAGQRHNLCAHGPLVTCPVPSPPPFPPLCHCADLLRCRCALQPS